MWVLFYIYVAASSNVVIGTLDFPTLESCQDAGKSMVEMSHYYTNHKTIAHCTEKNDEH